jgi:hypothetical protein
MLWEKKTRLKFQQISLNEHTRKDEKAKLPLIFILLALARPTRGRSRTMVGRGRRQPIAAVRRVRLLEIDRLLLYLDHMCLLSWLAAFPSTWMWPWCCWYLYGTMSVHLPSSSSEQTNKEFLTAWWSPCCCVARERYMLGWDHFRRILSSWQWWCCYLWTSMDWIWLTIIAICAKILVKSNHFLLYTIYMSYLKQW